MCTASTCAYADVELNDVGIRNLSGRCDWLTVGGRGRELFRALP
jgi:hypothetical protein